MIFIQTIFVSFSSILPVKGSFKIPYLDIAMPRKKELKLIRESGKALLARKFYSLKLQSRTKGARKSRYAGERFTGFHRFGALV